jgi:hypothetical protein
LESLIELKDKQDPSLDDVESALKEVANKWNNIGTDGQV